MSVQVDLSKFSSPPIKTVEELEEILTRPTQAVTEALSKLDGDLLILGVGGKMGPTLAGLARRTCDEAGLKKRIIGVDVFPEPKPRERLEAAGIETISCDLLDRAALEKLPDIPNVIFMVGRKFGSTGAEYLTWTINTFLPGLVAERYKDSRIVAFSSGNIYPFTPVASGGATEETPPDPLGEYAQSCVGRERMFEQVSHRFGTKVLIFRLNYAVELRYGVILDNARKVYSNTPIDLAMGNANVIWQGDANARVLQSFTLCESPPRFLNITGPETMSIRWLATRLGDLMDREPIFEGTESDTALLNNAAQSHKIFGYPTVPLEQVVEWVAYWVLTEGETLDKPTHYETRDGKF